MLRGLVVMLIAVAAMVPASAYTATLIFGNSDAQRCYEEARFGNGTAAVRACNNALRDGALSRRDTAATYVNRGILFNRAKRYADAIEDFNQAIGINPALGPAFLNRGNSYFFRKDFPAAMADYERAIDLETGELHAAYFNRGLVQEIRGNQEAALADFREALRIAPDFLAAQARIEYYEARQAARQGSE